MYSFEARIVWESDPVKGKTSRSVGDRHLREAVQATPLRSKT